MRRVPALALILSAIFVTAAQVSAQEEEKGQADLDRAIEARLSANSLRELNEVVALCETALQKGLSQENADFARQLLSAALQQRGTTIGEAIFSASGPPEQWPQMRQMSLADLERAVEMVNENPAAHLLIARLHLLPGGDADRARTALDEVIEQTADDAHSQAEALVLRSRTQDDAEKRIADLDQAVKLAPKKPQAYRARGALKLAANKPEEALADFDKALEIEPDSAETHEARGLAHAALKNWEEARKSYDRAVEINPESTDALLQRGRLNIMASDDEGAIKDFTEALQIDGENLAALVLRAEVLQQAGQPEMAIEDLNKALRLRPGWIPALRMRSGLLFDSGRAASAVADMELARKLDSDDPSTLLQLAMMYSALQKPRKAISHYERVLNSEPDNWFARRGRADALLSVGNQQEAIAEYEKALELKPDDSGILNNLAWVLATSPEESIRDGQRAIELATKACEETEFKAPHILSTLAAGYAETGDFDEARKWSKQALELAGASNRDALAKELESYEKSEPVRELQVITEEQEAEPLPDDVAPVATPDEGDLTLQPSSSDEEKPEPPGDDESEQPQKNDDKPPFEDDAAN